MKITERAKARFWSKIGDRAPGECWNWVAKRARNGYGRFSIGRKRFNAHRFSFELTNGPIRKGALILHSCDNRACVNPDHLREGSHAQNSKDRSERYVCPRGSRNNHSKLGRTHVVEIRARFSKGESCRSISEDFDVAESSISNIIRGKSWAHVPGAVTHGRGKRVKLSEADVRDIRKLKIGGESNVVIGERFGVTRASIANIISGRTWKNVV